MGMHIGTPVGGGTHTTYETYGVKTFTSSGTFTTKVPLKCDVLIVAKRMREHEEAVERKEKEAEKIEAEILGKLG